LKEEANLPVVRQVRDMGFPVRWPGGYEALLGLRESWRVSKVKLDSGAGRVDVWIEDRSSVKRK